MITHRRCVMRAEREKEMKTAQVPRKAVTMTEGATTTA